MGNYIQKAEPEFTYSLEYQGKTEFMVFPCGENDERKSVIMEEITNSYLLSEYPLPELATLKRKTELFAEKLMVPLEFIPEAFDISRTKSQIPSCTSVFNSFRETILPREKASKKASERLIERVYDAVKILKMKIEALTINEKFGLTGKSFFSAETINVFSSPEFCECQNRFDVAFAEIENDIKNRSQSNKQLPAEIVSACNEPGVTGAYFVQKGLISKDLLLKIAESIK